MHCNNICFCILVLQTSGKILFCNTKRMGTCSMRADKLRRNNNIPSLSQGESNLGPWGCRSDPQPLREGVEQGPSDKQSLPQFNRRNMIFIEETLNCNSSEAPQKCSPGLDFSYQQFDSKLHAPLSKQWDSCNCHLPLIDGGSRRRAIKRGVLPFVPGFTCNKI